MAWPSNKYQGAAFKRLPEEDMYPVPSTGIVKKVEPKRPPEHKGKPPNTEPDKPLVDGLLVLLVGLHEPLPDAHKAAVHEAALQQVVDGFEQERATLVRQAALPLAVLLACGRHRESVRISAALTYITDATLTMKAIGVHFAPWYQPISIKT